MKVPERSFISNNEILFLGYSSKKESFSRMLYKEFKKAEITVYPYNPAKSDLYDVKVYNDYSELDKIPETAYILMNRENTMNAFKSLKDTGVKKILFHNKKHLTMEIQKSCKAAGIEVAAACPMMLIGGGIHKFHRFLANLGR